MIKDVTKQMMHTTALLLVFIVCNSAAFFYSNNEDILTLLASNNSILSNTNLSNYTLVKNASRYDASCNNPLSVSCRLPSCDIQPMQQGCPVQGTSPNISSAYNSLRAYPKNR